MSRPLAAALAILALALVPAAPWVGPGGAWPGGWLVGPAWADDDDGGGDDDSDDGDDDDDDDDSSSRSDDRADRERERAEDRGRRPGGARGQNRRSSGAAAPAPEFAPELVVRDLAETDLVALLAEGFGLLERIALPGGTLTRLAAPPGLTLDGARDRVRALPAAPATDFNHFYRTGQGAALPAAQPAEAPCLHANCAAWALVGWPASCAVGLTVGVIDTGVNLDHDQIAGAAVELIRLAPEAAPPSGRVHGTAVVSLLAGQRTDRVAGLIPAAPILAIDIFTRAGADERADAISLVRALEEMAARGVRLVNLSLSGPPNAVLSEALDRLTGPGGMVVIAAVGNGGPEAEPAAPAAHPGVVAVTAVDARGRLYGAAQRGGHVDLAAPGVNLTVATSIRGARAQSGTSFAVPFVTAAAAVLLTREPGLDGPGVAARLSGLARDLGAPGRDPLYGAGVLGAGGLCG